MWLCSSTSSILPSGWGSNACSAPLRVPSIVLPLGISFFTFQAMSYVLDVYHGTSRPQCNPLDVGLYIVLFPQLVAVPILRYETVAEEISNRRETWSDFAGGLCRFAVGFGKKMLLANPLAIIADTAFDGANWIPLNTAVPGAPFSTGLAWAGIVAYTFQIYFDFSGYSDMALAWAHVRLSFPGELRLSLRVSVGLGILAPLAYFHGLLVP